MNTRNTRCEMMPASSSSTIMMVNDGLWKPILGEWYRSLHASYEYSDCCYVRGCNPHIYYLRWFSDTWVTPCTGQCPASCLQFLNDSNWWHWLAVTFLRPESNWEHLRCYGASETRDRPSRSSLMLWSRSGKRSPGHHLISYLLQD